MAFKNLLGDLALPLPYGTKVYVVEPLDAEVGPRAQALVDLMLKAASGLAPESLSDEDTELLSDLGERAFYPQILGAAYDEMVADRVPWAVIKRAAVAAMFDACLSRDQAEAAWNGEGKAPNRATKRAASKVATATRTRTPASTAGTNRSKPSPRSRGPRSSSTVT